MASRVNGVAFAFTSGLAVAIALVATPIVSWSVGVVGALSLALLSLPAWAARGLLVVPLFTRLSRASLLEGGVRPRIVSLLRAEPGLGITDLCARLDVGWGTAVHHLTRLEDAGLVVSQDAGRRRRFFLAEESATRRTAVCVLSSDLNRRILETVRDRPGLSQTDLCGALGISAPLAHKYLSRLVAANLVTSTRHWRTVQYYPGSAVDATLHEFAQIAGAQEAEGLDVPV